jgi:transcriptional regulator with XRE-family HTH domain
MADYYVPAYGDCVKIDGQKVKARRITLKLSQNDLASATGISQSHIAKVENGKVLGRAKDLQEKLAKGLRTTVEQICIADDEEPSEAGQTVVRASPEVEALLLDVFDKAAGHIFADVDAVRMMIVEASAGLESPKVARRLLDAAARVRMRGDEASATHIALEVAAGLDVERGNGKKGRAA